MIRLYGESSDIYQSFSQPSRKLTCLRTLGLKIREHLAGRARVSTYLPMWRRGCEEGNLAAVVLASCRVFPFLVERNTLLA